MAMVDLPDMNDDPGTLANNYMFVRGLQSSLSTTDTNLKAVSGSLRVVIEEQCWRRWLTMEGKEFNSADFRTFIEAPRPLGCQTKVSFLNDLLRGTDLFELFQEAIRGERGNPTGANQYTSGNRDDITVSTCDGEDVPNVIPLSPDAPRPRKRDYSREAPTGTSVSYSIRRLKKAAAKEPERLQRLYEDVVSGKVSAHKAMVQAGFVRAMISIPLDPVSAARLILKHFQPDAVAALVNLLQQRDSSK